MKCLADKAYPDLEEAARQQLALQHYLGQIENPQIAFGVKQRRPKTVEEAVGATLELESNLAPGKTRQVAHISAGDDREVTLLDMMAQLMRRMDQIETASREAPTRRSISNPRRGDQKDTSQSEQEIQCHNCGKPGQYARGCAAPKSGKGP